METFRPYGLRAHNFRSQKLTVSSFRPTGNNSPKFEEIPKIEKGSHKEHVYGFWPSKPKQRKKHKKVKSRTRATKLDTLSLKKKTSIS